MITVVVNGKSQKASRDLLTSARRDHALATSEEQCLGLSLLSSIGTHSIGQCYGSYYSDPVNSYSRGFGLRGHTLFLGMGVKSHSHYSNPINNSHYWRSPLIGCLWGYIYHSNLINSFYDGIILLFMRLHLFWRGVY